jgi:hypothetical protein
MPTIIFLHIGKTGGTTLRRVIRRQYPEREIMLVRAVRRPREETLADFAALPAAERSRPRLIMGHTVFGLHEMVPGGATYITMLRDPRALALSQYDYVRRTPGHRHHADALRMSLREYVDSGIAPEMSNSQTRALAGAVDVPYGESPPELLDQAKRHVEQHFTAVGLTERFDESLVLLGHVFGWSRLHYVRAKVGPRHLEPDSETQQRIDQLNALDLQLYRWASERFDDALRAIDDFDARLASFRRGNTLYRPWGSLRYTIPGRVRSALLARG